MWSKPETQIPAELIARRDQAALAVLITQAAKLKSLGPRRAMFLSSTDLNIAYRAFQRNLCPLPGVEETPRNGLDGRLPGEGRRGCRGACRRAHIRGGCAGRGGSVLGEPPSHDGSGQALRLQAPTSPHLTPCSQPSGLIPVPLPAPSAYRHWRSETLPHARYFGDSTLVL